MTTVSKNFLEKFLHRAILPGALRADLRSLKSVPDRFLTLRSNGPKGGCHGWQATKNSPGVEK